MTPASKSIIMYFALPGIIPRLKRLFGSGFSYISYYMASVLNVARLLPDHHPYLQAANFGRYGIHHVLGQAWRNLEFKKKNTDQIIIFFSLALGVVLLFIQMILFVLAFLMPVANAGVGAEFSRFFETMNHETDLAFIFMDRVFGMPGVFNSSVSMEANWPTPFHYGLHDLFSYYNTGLAIVAFLIIIYYVIAVTAETAYTGVPFGKRFNHAMAPIRLILALALLVPINNGMNGAQMITLYMAKWGSGLATNGWALFTSELVAETPLGRADQLVATPNAPQINSIVEFMFVAVTCQFAYELSSANEPVQTDRYQILPYVILPNDGAIVLGSGGAETLDQILGLNNNRNVIIRFGHRDSDWYPKLESHIKPLCGEIQINIQDLEEPGAKYVQNAYVFDLVLRLWNDVSNRAYARNLTRNKLSMISGRDPTLEKPTNEFIQDTFDEYKRRTEEIIRRAVLAQIEQGDWDLVFTEYGWGGAAIWFNKIAQFNGSLISSVFNLPAPRQYPELMEQVLDLKSAEDKTVIGSERYNPVLANGMKVFPSGRDQEFAELFYEAQTYWMPSQNNKTGNYFKNAIIMLFGLEGLMNIRENVNIHPLAQLVGIGRGLIESALQNFGYSFGGWVGGMVTEDIFKRTSQNAFKFFKSVAMIGLSIGFVLYYVLPFLPFIYFFIALSNWVKTVFEAMIGLPLWALAHIRIEGKGIPGPAAMNGYYLIFEVFVNPILIVFGMLAGIVIFSAQVVVLNEIWKLVVANVTGNEADTMSKTVEDSLGSIRYLRREFDQFFFTAMYAVFVYLMGLASFKLVDAIPDKILRWLGSSAKSFNETADNIAGELVSQGFKATQGATDNVDSVMSGMLLKDK